MSLVVGIDEIEAARASMSVATGDQFADGEKYVAGTGVGE